VQCAELFLVSGESYLRAHHYRLCSGLKSIIYSFTILFQPSFLVQLCRFLGSRRFPYQETLAQGSADA
jgi:hypothetical protein